MSKPQRLVDKRLAKALLTLQIITIPIVTILAWFIQDVVAAKSAAIGATIYVLANAFFAWQAFKNSGARASQQVLNNMYIGLIGKFVIVIVGLALILSTISPINMLAVLAGLVLVQAMSWIAPFWLSKQSKQ